MMLCVGRGRPVAAVVALVLFLTAANADSHEKADIAQSADAKNSHVLMRRNFIRFGKRTSDEDDSDDKAAAPSPMARSMQRRDYREFVRFGKRSAGLWEGPLLLRQQLHGFAAENEDGAPVSALGAASREVFEGLAGRDGQPHRYNQRSFLRFGKRSPSSSPSWQSSQSTRTHPLEDLDAGDQEKRRDDFLRFGKRLAALDCVVYGLCSEADFEDLEAARGKKSNDFLRFG